MWSYVVPVMTGHSSLWVSLTSLARLGEGTDQQVHNGAGRHENRPPSAASVFEWQHIPIVLISMSD